MSKPRTIYTKNAYCDRINLPDDGTAEFTSLINAVAKTRKLVKKGGFKDVRLTFDRVRNWSSSDEFSIEVRGDRPETEHEKKCREGAKYRHVKFLEQQLAEATAAYEEEQRKVKL